MLKILDKVVTTMTNIIVATTTIITTLLIPLVILRGIKNLSYTDNLGALISFISVAILIHINKSVQGGR